MSRDLKTNDISVSLAHVQDMCVCGGGGGGGGGGAIRFATHA